MPDGAAAAAPLDLIPPPGTRPAPGSPASAPSSPPSVYAPCAAPHSASHAVVSTASRGRPDLPPTRQTHRTRNPVRLLAPLVRRHQQPARVQRQHLRTLLQRVHPVPAFPARLLDNQTRRRATPRHPRRIPARPQRSRRHRRQQHVQRQMPFRRGKRRHLLRGVPRRLRVHTVPQVRRRQVQTQAVSREHNLPHVRLHLADALHRGPRNVIGREPNHVRNFGEYVAHDARSTSSPGSVASQNQGTQPPGRRTSTSRMEQKSK